MTAPDWPQVVADMMLVVETTKHAFVRTRRSKAKLAPDESRRVLALNREIEKYRHDARKALAQAAAGDGAVEWRPLVLNLLRAHSAVWERLRVEHDYGIPQHIETGLVVEGRDARADQFILQAVEALAATNERFECVSWNGREVMRSSVAAK